MSVFTDALRSMTPDDNPYASKYDRGEELHTPEQREVLSAAVIKLGAALADFTDETVEIQSLSGVAGFLEATAEFAAKSAEHEEIRKLLDELGASSSI
jgi:hypothetical protein